jgi:thiamine pyrophosphate-dependent acetolactate synthase large subunit-like protein
MVEHGFRAVFSRKPDHLAHRVANLAAVARGYGADAAIIDRPALLEPSHLQSLTRRGVPLLLDIRIDREESLSASTRSAGFRR